MILWQKYTNVNTKGSKNIQAYVSPFMKDPTGKTVFIFLFQSPAISLPFLDNFICFCGNGMIESMLEPHLKGAAGASQV